MNWYASQPRIQGPALIYYDIFICSNHYGYFRIFVPGDVGTGESLDFVIGDFTPSTLL